MLSKLSQNERSVRADVRRDEGLILTQPARRVGPSFQPGFAQRYNTLVVTFPGLFISPSHLVAQ